MKKENKEGQPEYFFILQQVDHRNPRIFSPETDLCLVRAPTLEQAAKNLGFELKRIIERGIILAGRDDEPIRASLKSDKLGVDGELELKFIRENKGKIGVITLELQLK